MPCFEDIHDLQGDEVGHVDMLTAGYPCQGFSFAGKRLGEADPRFLWPEVHRIIRNVRPHYVLLENVTGHLALGFGRVLGDLAESGYDAEWDCIPASAVGAPHQRDRVFIIARPQQSGHVAHSSGRWGPDNGLRAGRHEPRQGGKDVAHSQGEQRNGGNHHARVGARSEAIPEPRNGSRQAHVANPAGSRLAHGWRESLVEPRAKQELERCRESLGSAQWATEPAVGRLADGIPHRVDQLRALGNAVVPQVAEYLGRLIPAEVPA